MEEVPQNTDTRVHHRKIFKAVLFISAALLLFLFAIDLMISSLQHLGGNITQTIIQATSNPFMGLFIGLLVTAMAQSSSTTTTLTVAMVASGSLTLAGAVPVIMGANVGTTITAVIVSLGFISRKKEFKRAVAAGSYHCFFNLLTVIVLFPLEYYYGFLSSLSAAITDLLFFARTDKVAGSIPAFAGSLFTPAVQWTWSVLPNIVVWIGLSFVTLFSSILIFRRLISDLLQASSPETFSRFFFGGPLKSFGWGLITTAAIRSSTITTSVVVPIVAKKITSLRRAAPFILGANIGTTVTAFIAAAINANTSGAITIAIVHVLFNVMGVLIFFPVPTLRQIPIELAFGLGNLTRRYRLAGLVFILLTFFILPFALIYLSQE